MSKIIGIKTTSHGEESALNLQKDHAGIKPINLKR